MVTVFKKDITKATFFEDLNTFEAVQNYFRKKKLPLWYLYPNTINYNGSNRDFSIKSALKEAKKKNNRNKSVNVKNNKKSEKSFGPRSILAELKA